MPVYTSRFIVIVKERRGEIETKSSLESQIFPKSIVPDVDSVGNLIHISGIGR